MKKLLGLRTAIYLVPDLDAAKKWYAKAFQTDPYYDESYYVGFNIGGFELGLMPDNDPPEDKSTNVRTYWGTEDLDAQYKHFLNLKASEFEKPQNVGGEIVVAAVKDPWGNLIGLIYNPHFEIS